MGTKLAMIPLRKLLRLWQYEVALRIKGMWETVSEREGKPAKLILSFRMVCPSFDIFKKALKELEADGFKVKETLTGDFLVTKGEEK